MKEVTTAERKVTRCAEHRRKEQNKDDVAPKSPKGQTEENRHVNDLTSKTVSFTVFISKSVCRTEHVLEIELIFSILLVSSRTANDEKEKIKYFRNFFRFSF
jgi:hypothetical protein